MQLPNQHEASSRRFRKKMRGKTDIFHKMRKEMKEREIKKNVKELRSEKEAVNEVWENTWDRTKKSETNNSETRGERNEEAE